MNRLSRADERYRQTDDRRTGDSIPYSEREREFTFAKNGSPYAIGPLSVLSVSNVRALWPNGRTDQDVTWRAGRPRPWPHCVRWGPSSPSPKGYSPHPIFGPYLLRQMAAWIKMPLGMEQGLSPGDFVLDGNPTQPLNFRPMFIIVRPIVILLEHCTMHSQWKGDWRSTSAAGLDVSTANRRRTEAGPIGTEVQCREELGTQGPPV